MTNPFILLIASPVLRRFRPPPLLNASFLNPASSVLVSVSLCLCGGFCLSRPSKPSPNFRILFFSRPPGLVCGRLVNTTSKPAQEASNEGISIWTGDGHWPGSTLCSHERPGNSRQHRRARQRLGQLGPRKL